MFCKLISYCLNGMTATPITVEVDLSDGLPCFEIVGLPDSAVRESKERVRSAIKNSGLSFPVSRITVNLAPADIRKEGALYDLPIALGILCCAQKLSKEQLEGKLFLGELALDGSLRAVRGSLSIVATALKDNTHEILLPQENEMTSFFSNAPIQYFSHLKEVIDYLKTGIISPLKPNAYIQPTENTLLDFQDVKGQEQAKRALIIAASGYHNLLFIGPPGSGKSMLAKRVPTIMPPLSPEEYLEVAQIYNLTTQTPLVSHSLLRPFRAPHHTVSLHGLVGGGTHPKPGEVSLAHHGVLFLDELLEFSKKSIDVLRQPLEDHQVTISRVKGNRTYPADFLLIAATNPCPCGYYPDTQQCHCDLPSIRRYLKKLSGPILDRIELQVETFPVSPQVLHQKGSISSAQMKQQVLAAQAIQKDRFKTENFNYNSQMTSPLADKYCILDISAQQLMNHAMTHFNLSARSYYKILKMSRTIADLEQASSINEAHLSEALSYRLLERFHV